MPPDSSFTAKISDFGMSRPADRDIWKPTAGTPAYLAPELLRGDFPTTRSDVYAFGILMWGVFARVEPYLGESLYEVMHQVADVSRNPPKRPWGDALRPPSSLCPDFFSALMSRCCDNTPDKRPTFQEILMSLKALDVPGLVDSMLTKAAGHVRSTQLLHDVFPPRVARALAEGRTVEPEHYESVTIFFSGEPKLK